MNIYINGKAYEDPQTARAALDELIEEDAGEWVDCGSEETGTGYTYECRIRRDGSQPQELYESSNDWVDTEYGNFIGVYRKGREVALEQVQELVEAVQTSPLGFVFRGQHPSSFDPSVGSAEFLATDPRAVYEWLCHIRTLARELEAKK